MLRSIFVLFIWFLFIVSILTKIDRSKTITFNLISSSGNSYNCDSQKIVIRIRAQAAPIADVKRDSAPKNTGLGERVLLSTITS